MPKTLNDWPKVVFRGDAISSAGLGKGEVADLIRELAQSIGDEPLPIVRRFVVADMPNYAEAIRAEQGGGIGPTHTDRPEYQGIAKTIPTAHDDGTIDQTIVICSGPVAAALDCSTAIEPFMPKGLALYLLRHELAHCIDHLRRGIGIRVSFSTQDAFSVARVCDYYRPILMTELAACVFAGADLDDETFDLLMSLDQDPLESELQRDLSPSNCSRSRVVLWSGSRRIRSWQEGVIRQSRSWGSCVRRRSISRRGCPSRRRASRSVSPIRPTTAGVVSTAG